MKKAITLLLSAAMVISLASCGGILRKEETAQGKAEMQKEIEGVVKESGIHGLPSGLKGSCTGNNPNLSSVTLETSGQYLSIEIPTPLTNANESLMYSIMFSDSTYNQGSQVGFKKVFSDNSYTRFVYDLNGSEGQKTYPGDFGTDFTEEEFSTNIPDPAIKGSKNTTWIAYLSVDGQDIATCPADGSSATLE